MMLDLECGDCWAMRELSGLGALGGCPKHATPDQKAAADRKILELATAEHPLLRAVRRPK